MRAALLLAFVSAFFHYSASASASEQQCRETYKSLFSKSTIKIRMVFGYKDARPARFVGDRHERLWFIERITSPCGRANHACGFSRSSHNADLFQKRITVEGGKPVTVLLYVVGSSVGSDDLENRKDPFQKRRSQYAQAGFLSGLKDADIVFYNGHSRFGGGPDFGPPILDKDEKIEASVYQNKRPGITKFLKALENSTAKKNRAARPEPRMKILGLFSCASDQHFKKDLRRRSNAGLIVNETLIYYSDAMESSLYSLSKILERRCMKNLSFD